MLTLVCFVRVVIFVAVIATIAAETHYSFAAVRLTLKVRSSVLPDNLVVSLSYFVAGRDIAQWRL